MPNLNKEKDDHGWIALHYAAYKVSAVWIDISELLLKYDSSVACIQEKSGLSPLHIATSKGNTELIELLIKHCPDCWQVCDKDGRNCLHIASLTGCIWVIEETIKKDNIFRGCINKPDKDGNTPMHLLGKSFPSPQIVRQLLDDVRVNKLALNRENMNVYGAMFEDIFKVSMTIGLEEQIVYDKCGFFPEDCQKRQRTPSNMFLNGSYLNHSMDDGKDMHEDKGIGGISYGGTQWSRSLGCRKHGEIV